MNRARAKHISIVKHFAISIGIAGRRKKFSPMMKLTMLSYTKREYGYSTAEIAP
jgi:hypothetical protein